MANPFLEKLIASKITELTQYSVDFLETEYRKLTPAGKFQACIMTAGIIIQMLGNKNTFNPTNGANVHEIISILEDEFLVLFNKYRIEYENSGKKSEKFGNEYLDKLNEIGNNILINHDNIFAKKSVKIGVGHFWSEFDGYVEGFKKYNTGTGKVVVPEVSFISLYIFPFFLSLVSNSEKPETAWLIQSNLKSVRSINEMDFILIPSKLSNHLINLINKDVNLVAALISANRPTSQNISNNTNGKGCYVATLAYNDINHPKVEFLRKYRDNRLSKNVLGKKFIKLYYRYSPRVVEFIKPYKRINKLIKNGLDFLIFIIKRTE